MKKLTYLILLGLIVSSCNNPEPKSKTLNKDVSVEIRYFDNTLDTISINGYEGIEDDLNLDGGEVPTYLAGYSIEKENRKTKRKKRDVKNKLYEL